MKIFILTLSLMISLSAYCQEAESQDSSSDISVLQGSSNDSSSKCGDGIAKCINLKPKPPKGVCRERCSKIKNPEKMQACLAHCSADKPEKLSCSERCASIEDPEKKIICKKKCQVKKKHRKGKLASLGCERTDPKTITCGDGIYVKVKSVNESELIKEIKDSQIDIKKNKNKASQQ